MLIMDVLGCIIFGERASIPPYWFSLCWHCRLWLFEWLEHEEPLNCYFRREQHPLFRLKLYNLYFSNLLFQKALESSLSINFVLCLEFSLPHEKILGSLIPTIPMRTSMRRQKTCCEFILLPSLPPFLLSNDYWVPGTYQELVVEDSFSEEFHFPVKSRDFTF